MSERQEQFKSGLQKLFASSNVLRESAFKAWRAFHGDSTVKSMVLPPGDYLSYQELFFHCVKRRGERSVLNMEKLRSFLGSDWEDWLVALQQTGNFTLPPKEREQDELFHRLCFEIPDIDWRIFRAELRAGTDIAVIKDAFRTMKYLMQCTPDPIAPAELGAQLFHDSKRLKNSSLLTWLFKFLRQKNPAEESCSDAELLEKFGLNANPTASTVMVYGSFFYESAGEKMEWIDTLYRRNESAILSCDNLRDLGRVTTTAPVLSIENETVFNRMKQSNPEYALIYTAGFPGRAVRKWVAALSPETPLFHWGDSDPEGYEIAAILHEIHPLKLFRCDVVSLESMRDLAIELPVKKQKRAERLAQNPAFPFLPEIKWILDNQCWLEQESFYFPDNGIKIRQ